MPEGCLGFPGTRAVDSCHMELGIRPGSYVAAAVLLAAKPSLQHLPSPLVLRISLGSHLVAIGASFTNEYTPNLIVNLLSFSPFVVKYFREV